jgi:malonate transporter
LILWSEVTDHPMISLVFYISPIFILIGLGALIKRQCTFGEQFWTDIERLTFYILFPALLVHSIGGANFDNLFTMVPMATALITSCFIMTGACIFLRSVIPSTKFDDASFCSLLQGVTRPNTYIGLALAFALYGERGLAILAVCVVAVIPLVNIISVLVHQSWLPPQNEEGGQTSLFNVFTGTLKNPVVAACFVGFFLNVSTIGLPPVIGPVLDILGKGALPLGLIAVGAGLSFRTLSTSPLLYLIIALAKLLVLPAITYFIAVYLKVDGIYLTVSVLFSALPVSATSYVMSRQMQGNASMMAAIISSSTMVSLITIPLLAAVSF